MYVQRKLEKECYELQNNLAGIAAEMTAIKNNRKQTIAESQVSICFLL